MQLNSLHFCSQETLLTQRQKTETLQQHSTFKFVIALTQTKYLNKKSRRGEGEKQGNGKQVRYICFMNIAS